MCKAVVLIFGLLELKSSYFGRITVSEESITQFEYFIRGAS